MRSRLICALFEGTLLAFAAAPAQADGAAVRARLSVADLPFAAEPKEIAAKDAVLPLGAREGGRVPAAWPKGSDEWTDPMTMCVDDRMGDVMPMRDGYASGTRIFERGGKTFLDRVSIQEKDGIVHVKDARRVPLARIADGLYAYRTKTHVMLVMAADDGAFDHSAYYGCSIREAMVASPAGTAELVSSASAADGVMRMMKGDEAKSVLPKWRGADARVMASVSRSSADPGPMLSIVLRRPSAS